MPWLFLVYESFNGMEDFGAMSGRTIQSQNFGTEC